MSIDRMVLNKEFPGNGSLVSGISFHSKCFFKIAVICPYSKKFILMLYLRLISSNDRETVK